MHLSPVRLKDNRYGVVVGMLKKFYLERPDSYGLLNRSEIAYLDYANFIEKVSLSKHIDVLDFGSGTWRLPQTIANKGFNSVTGLDFFSNDKLEEYNQQLTSTNVRLETYNGGAFPFIDNSFDIVTSLCVVEHILPVEKILDEMVRVLKPGGIIIIQAPNWSSPNVAFPALVNMLKKQKRYWLFNNLFDVLIYPLRTIKWYLEVYFTSTPKFIYVNPRINKGVIDFETADDDVVHLCQPLSFKRYFRANGCKIITYNRGHGTTKYTKIFNVLLPSLASINVIVAQKKIN